jgi:hypothetical protein
LTIVGPLPADINLEIVYGGAATTDSAAPDAASGLREIYGRPRKPPCLEGGRL